MNTLLLAATSVLFCLALVLFLLLRRSRRQPMALPEVSVNTSGTAPMAEKFYMHLFRSMSIPVLICSPEGIIQTANAAAARSLREKLSAMPGSNLMDYVYGEDQEDLSRMMQEILAEGRETHLPDRNHWLVRKDGSTLLARMSLTLFRDLQGVPGFFCVISDISHSMMQDKQIRDYTRALESRLNARNKELSGKNRLLAEKNRELVKINKSKNTFFANISHELRTPLVAVRGYMEMLLEESLGPINDRIRESFTIATENLQRLIGFINNLLDLARVDNYRDNPDYQPVHLRGKVGQILYQFREQASAKGVALINEVPDELPGLVIDPVHLEQILFNLISNAVKFTSRGEIRIRALELMQDKIELQVSDTGCGIAPADVPFIFNRFYQVSRKNTSREMGSGLGLAIVKEIVTHYEGKIEVRENPGGGSIFVLELNSPFRPRAKTRRTGRILTVSSNESQNSLIRAFFTEHGYRVETARTGLQAIEVLEDGTFDIVFCDLYLPDLEGTEISALLRDKGRDPVYIITFSLTEEERNRIFMAGARGLITKPFHAQALQRVLHEGTGKTDG